MFSVCRAFLLTSYGLLAFSLHFPEGLFGSLLKAISRAASGRSLLAEGERPRRSNGSKKKLMQTNIKSPTDQNAEVQAQSQSELKQRKWNLFMGEEPYGFVHASSEAEALDRVRAFRRPFRAVLAPEQD